MGFFTGRVTFLRYRVEGRSPKTFGPQHLEKLAARAIGTQKEAHKDGAEAGWTAGADILDVNFDLAKNVVSDMLHFALRVDTQRLPADLLRAYAGAELRALAAGNPSGLPSAKQKKEARQAARERLEEEAKDGRYTRRKAYPVLWDAQANHVLIGATAAGAIDHARRLFQETFGGTLVLLDAGAAATERGQDTGKADSLASLHPAAFTPANRGEVAWVKDEMSLNYLGNEFLLWLWHTLEADGDSLRLPDDSEVTAMFARTLALECPRAQTGSETIRSESPSRLPEARRALETGKLPRQAGLIVVRHDQQYEVTLQAETLAVLAARLPVIEEDDEHARVEERATQLRHLIETVDLVYAAFLERRLGSGWTKELQRVQKWLTRDDRRAATA